MWSSSVSGFKETDQTEGTTKTEKSSIAVAEILITTNAVLISTSAGNAFRQLSI
jgi:hypothetical protein